MVCALGDEIQRLRMPTGDTTANAKYVLVEQIVTQVQCMHVTIQVGEWRGDEEA